MIRELAETTWSLLGHYYERELSGELTRRETQQRTIRRIRNLRYGPEKRLLLDQRYGAPDDHPPLSD